MRVMAWVKWGQRCRTEERVITGKCVKENSWVTRQKSTTRSWAVPKDYFENVYIFMFPEALRTIILNVVVITVF